eukprot:TRINITY_DN103910_c0_g1_i1.p1 TRINITY_DN103910_c0_g1~~TRINITY_DN103910_c0_g1_i1.p1  ORF type:complete len:507 (-),score=43.03 TRINITY_DN103910_c0_g1_i1:146-1666(-)
MLVRLTGAECIVVGIVTSILFSSRRKRHMPSAAQLKLDRAALQTQAKIKDTAVTIYLTDDNVVVKQNNYSVFPLADIFAVEAEATSPTLTIHVAMRKKQTVAKIIATFGSQEDVTTWETQLCAAAHLPPPPSFESNSEESNKPTEGPRGLLPKIRVMIIVNPFGGKKKAPILWSQHCLPILNTSRQFEITMNETTHAGHAQEMVHSMDISQFDVIGTCSGDGLVHEMLNGLLTRPDWDNARKLPLALIPGGSGNGVAYSLGNINAQQAGIAITKGNTSDIDIFSVWYNNKKGELCRKFSILSLTFAFIADVDLRSEGKRWMGPSRYLLQAVLQVMKYPKYKAKLSYLPKTESPPEPVDVGVPGPPSILKHAPNDQPPEDWTTLEDFLFYWAVTNVQWIDAGDTKASPQADFNDGLMDLGFAKHNKDTGRLWATKQMLKLENGGHTADQQFQYHQVHAAQLIPLCDDAVMSLDGEFFPVTPVTMEAHHGLCRVLLPPGITTKGWRSD